MGNLSRIAVAFLLLMVVSQSASASDSGGVLNSTQYAHPVHLYYPASILTRDSPGVSFRAVSSSLSLPYLISSAVIGHERAHQGAALVNGAESASIKWESTSFMTGETRWKGNLSREQEMKIISAGLTWNNNQAEDVIQSHLGGGVSMDDLLWYGINQLNMTRYIMAPPADNRFHDVDTWVHLLGNEDEMTMQQIRKDLRVGAAWQAVSSLLPAVFGMNWLMGGAAAIPNSWVNTQTELSDAGVIYGLSLWHRTKNNIIAKVRPGYGLDRNEDAAIYSLEGEVSNIPVAGLLADLDGGFARTKEGSRYFGISLKKALRNRSLLVLSSHWYSGYHRNNPSASAGYVEVMGEMSLPF
jgi:hypothetical protein